jgi:hypothetical protein
MGCGMSQDAWDGLTACSYEKHSLSNKPRVNDLDFCDHPKCKTVVVNHYKHKMESLLKTLEENCKRHEEIQRRLCDHLGILLKIERAGRSTVGDWKGTMKGVEEVCINSKCPRTIILHYKSWCEELEKDIESEMKEHQATMQGLVKN